MREFEFKVPPAPLPDDFFDGGADDDDGAAAASSSHDSQQQQQQTLDMERVLEQARDIEVLSRESLRRTLGNLERRIARNRELRMKFAADPDKFMESEMDLHEDLLFLQQLGAAPELLTDAQLLASVPQLLDLLAHENADIALLIVQLVGDLSEPESVGDAEQFTVLLDKMLEHHLLSLLVQNMRRLNRSDEGEADGIQKSLSAIENLCEFNPELAERFASETDLLPYLLDGCKRQDFDATQFYCGELLAILLQTSEKVIDAAATRLGALDSLLRAVANYRKRSPSTLEESEFVANLFDSICAILLLPAHREHFVQLEGLELMLRLVAKQARFTDAAVRVLDFALQDNARGAAHLVDVLGLRTVFPLFMGRVPDASAGGGAASKRKRQKREEDAFDEHMLAIVVSLSKTLEDGHLQRLVAKFAENDFEKVDRTLELYEKFREKLKRAEERNAAAWSALDDDEVYAERLGAGLAPLHSAALLLAFLHTPVSAAVGATGRAQQLLKQQNIGAVDVLELLDEYRLHIGSGGEDEDEAAASAREGVTSLMSCVMSVWGIEAVEDDGAGQVQ